jgi:hypothetical protein
MDDEEYEPYVMDVPVRLVKDASGSFMRYQVIMRYKGRNLLVANWVPSLDGPMSDEVYELFERVQAYAGHEEEDED